MKPSPGQIPVSIIIYNLSKTLGIRHVRKLYKNYWWKIFRNTYFLLPTSLSLSLLLSFEISSSTLIGETILTEIIKTKISDDGHNEIVCNIIIWEELDCLFSLQQRFIWQIIIYEMQNILLSHHVQYVEAYPGCSLNS